MSRIVVISSVGQHRIRRVEAWLESRAAGKEVRIVGATLDAANELARRAAKKTGPHSVGIS
jgi:threonine dehydratase